jgi:hypothetical protein
MCDYWLILEYSSPYLNCVTNAVRAIFANLYLFWVIYVDKAPFTMCGLISLFNSQYFSFKCFQNCHEIFAWIWRHAALKYYIFLEILEYLLFFWNDITDKNALFAANILHYFPFLVFHERVKLILLNIQIIIYWVTHINIFLFLTFELFKRFFFFIRTFFVIRT